MLDKFSTYYRMPYKLVRVTGGYYVENKETGRRYSRDPIPLKNAERQLRALYYAEGGGGK
jgi:hypothetical protein